MVTIVEKKSAWGDIIKWGILGGLAYGGYLLLKGKIPNLSSIIPTAQAQPVATTPTIPTAQAQPVATTPTSPLSLSAQQTKTGNVVNVIGGSGNSIKTTDTGTSGTSGTTGQVSTPAKFTTTPPKYTSQPNIDITLAKLNAAPPKTTQPVTSAPSIDIMLTKINTTQQSPDFTKLLQQSQVTPTNKIVTAPAVQTSAPKATTPAAQAITLTTYKGGYTPAAQSSQPNLTNISGAPSTDPGAKVVKAIQNALNIGGIFDPGGAIQVNLGKAGINPAQLSADVAALLSGP